MANSGLDEAASLQECFESVPEAEAIPCDGLGLLKELERGAKGPLSFVRACRVADLLPAHVHHEHFSKVASACADTRRHTSGVDVGFAHALRRATRQESNCFFSKRQGILCVRAHILEGFVPGNK